jgi:uncharacterized membrane protein
MVLVGRFKGLRSVLGLGVQIFFILAFLLPCVYRGFSPVLASIITVTVGAAFSLLLLNGFGKKTYTALIATCAGVLLSGLFFVLMTGLTAVSGYNIAETDTLILTSRATGLRLADVLFAEVLVASIGAVTDTTVSVSAAMYELLQKRPDTPQNELFRSGIEVGRDMIGSMCQTLILAFAGGALGLFLTLMATGSDFNRIMSSDYVGIEIVHGLTGSLAVIAAVPLTAAVCAYLHGIKPRGAIAAPEPVGEFVGAAVGDTLAVDAYAEQIRGVAESVADAENLTKNAAKTENLTEKPPEKPPESAAETEKPPEPPPKPKKRAQKPPGDNNN